MASLRFAMVEACADAAFRFGSRPVCIMLVRGILDVHRAVMDSRRAKWLGSAMKENKIRYAIKELLDGEDGLTDETFDIVKSQHEYHC